MNNLVKNFTNQHLEYCISDKTHIDIVKSILIKDQVVKNGYVDVMNFAQWFAYTLEDQIEFKYGTSNWVKVYDMNLTLGENIAININNLIQTLSMRD